MMRCKPNIGVMAARVAITVLIAVTCSCSEFFLHQVNPTDVKKLREFCSKLEVPQSFVKVRERSLEKPEVVIYTAEYDSGEDIDDIEKFFKEQLVSQGWHYKPRKNGSTRFFDFRRSDFSIVIEFEDFQLGTSKHFLISCGLDAGE